MSNTSDSWQLWAEAIALEEEASRKLLVKEFTVEEKVALFDDLYRLGCEHLQSMMNKSSDDYVDEAFRSRVMRGLWEKEYFDWIYEKQWR